MKIRLLHDRVVIRRVEGNGTSKGVEGSIVAGPLTDAKDPDMGNAQTGLVEFKALSDDYRKRQFVEAGGWATMPGDTSANRRAVEGGAVALAA